jgi:hypothetical protein
VSAIIAAEVQADNPDAVAGRWAEIAQIDLRSDQAGHAVMLFDNAEVRFVPCADGRPEGLGGIDLKTTDKAAIMAAAEARGAITGENQITLCGTRFNLI